MIRQEVPELRCRGLRASVCRRVHEPPPPQSLTGLVVKRGVVDSVREDRTQRGPSPKPALLSPAPLHLGRRTARLRLGLMGGTNPVWLGRPAPRTESSRAAPLPHRGDCAMAVAWTKPIDESTPRRGCIDVGACLLRVSAGLPAERDSYADAEVMPPRPRTGCCLPLMSRGVSHSTDLPGRRRLVGYSPLALASIKQRGRVGIAPIY